MDRWTSDLIKLLRKWKYQISKRQRAHIDISAKYNKRHYLIAIPSLIISSAVSISSISTFKNCDNPDDCNFDQYIRLAGGIFNFAATILVSLQTFLQYQKQGEIHRTCADDYENLYRILDTYITVPTSRGDPVETLKIIKDQYDEIRKKSPPLLDLDNIDLDYEVFSKKNGSTSSEEKIRNSLESNHRGQQRRDTTSQNQEYGTNSTSSVRDQIDALNNNCDTEDDNAKVVIELDLDHCDSHVYTFPNGKSPSSPLQNKIRSSSNLLRASRQSYDKIEPIKDEYTLSGVTTPQKQRRSNTPTILDIQRLDLEVAEKGSLPRRNGTQSMPALELIN
jgi:hypothetical protein